MHLFKQDTVLSSSVVVETAMAMNSNQWLRSTAVHSLSSLGCNALVALGSYKRVPGKKERLPPQSQTARLCARLPNSYRKMPLLGSCTSAEN